VRYLSKSLLFMVKGEVISKFEKKKYEYYCSDNIGRLMLIVKILYT